MTEKRFNIKPSAIVDDVTVIIDSEKQYTFPTLDSTLNYMFCKVMNELADENEQLKQQLTNINRLIDNKIDEFKNGDYGDLPCNTIHMFLDLKQELGDVE